jgi:hypothetical protein
MLDLFEKPGIGEIRVGEQAFEAGDDTVRAGLELKHNKAGVSATAQEVPEYPVTASQLHYACWA